MSAIFLLNHHNRTSPWAGRWLNHISCLLTIKMSSHLLMYGKRYSPGGTSARWCVACIDFHFYKISFASLVFFQCKCMMMLQEEVKQLLALVWCQCLEGTNTLNQLLLSPGQLFVLDMLHRKSHSGGLTPIPSLIWDHQIDCTGFSQWMTFPEGHREASRVGHNSSYDLVRRNL